MEGLIGDVLLPDGGSEYVCPCALSGVGGTTEHEEAVVWDSPMVEKVSSVLLELEAVYRVDGLLKEALPPGTPGLRVVLHGEPSSEMVLRGVLPTDRIGGVGYVKDSIEEAHVARSGVEVLHGDPITGFETVEDLLGLSPGEGGTKSPLQILPNEVSTFLTVESGLLIIEEEGVRLLHGEEVIGVPEGFHGVIAGLHLGAASMEVALPDRGPRAPEGVGGRLVVGRIRGVGVD